VSALKANPKIRIKVHGFISSRQNAWLLRRLGETVEFHADQLIAIPGMYPGYSCFLRTGRVIAGIVNSANNQRLMLSFEENSLLLEQYQLTGKPCDLYYRAVSDCTAQMISYHDMTQERIGALSGLHRVTVSKELKKLRELGLVRLADGLYRIKSLQALIDYCDGRGGD
jgi:CRP-like cAMP-binding protein